MIHLRTDDRRQRRLPFYLAMEEWAAKTLPPDDYFFTWQVEPTVIFGRNQNIAAEVNLDYCHTNAIQTYRRKSGGGCVFADRHNIMFSYITPSEEVTSTFARYTGMIASMLRSLGIDAAASGRNDITIGGRKVSGNSFYHIPGRSIVHGTMLYDTDLRHMANAITPSRSKLESKQVKSVEAHITTLNRHTDIPLERFIDYTVGFLTDRAITLTPDDISQIEELALPYYDPKWIFGRRSTASIRRSRRIEGVGELSLGLDVTDGRITAIDLEGDFFILSDLDRSLLSHLTGIEYSRPAVCRALHGIDTSSVIAGLQTTQLIDFIINQ